MQEIVNRFKSSCASNCMTSGALVRGERSRIEMLMLTLVLLVSSARPLSAETAESVSARESVPPALIQTTQTAYILGPGDVFTVQVIDSEEFSPSKLIRVDGDGKVNLPLIGSISASGLTLSQLESEISKRLKVFLQSPQVIVQVSQFRSQPVSVLGYVIRPGIQEIQGPRTLVEVISMAGGLQATAGGKVKITRPKETGKIPLSGAIEDPTGQFSIAEVDIKAIMESKNLEENIPILPHDVVTVPKAPIVYVIGGVRKAGGFVLGDKESITVMQAISLAEGWDRFSAPNKAKILRLTSGTERTEIAMNLKALVDGKVKDIPMQPEDILIIPSSESKKIWARVGSTALSTVTGIAIYSTRY